MITAPRPTPRPFAELTVDEMLAELERMFAEFHAKRAPEANDNKPRPPETA